MRQKVFILYNENNIYVADKISKDIFASGKIYSENLKVSTDTFKKIIESGVGEYFYIIVATEEIVFPNFHFDYVPPEWDSKYLHTWNNKSMLRLYNTNAVRENIEYYTDTNFYKGNIQIKNIPLSAFRDPVFDIVFLSYDEEFADRNFQRLKEKYPRTQRIHGINGFLNAHRAAARLAKSSGSDMFYVVDADAEIYPGFTFSYNPHSLDRESVHIWHSKNPVNDLEYGYGAVKLFPTELTLNYAGTPVDFTTSIGKGVKVIPEISNWTRFNTDPYSAWRSAFRECAKLASKIIHNQDNAETEQRLDTWCSYGQDREFGDFVIKGAIEGREFGKKNRENKEILSLINNYQWLEQRFSES